MSFWRAILACTLLSACSADPTFLKTNSMIDPNRLFWWKTKWAPAPIQLGINNVSKTSTVTFFINPTTAITNGVFEVTFPSGFTLSSVGSSQIASSSVVQLFGQTYTAGVDYAVQITGVQNPVTAGGYGPFALRTRYSQNGQQVDVNLTFGSVYIYQAAGTLGSTLTGGTLVVALAGTSINNVINKSGNTLSFRFTIGVSLWRYDTFIINLDSKWTIASGATCSSADYSGRWNNFNGTNSANPHSLDCVITPQGSVGGQTAYIYGLAVDGLDLVTSADNAYVDLRITSVTTPNAVYGSSAYSWTVSTSRFGTATILETATYAAGPAVTYDTIATATWTPTWGLPASSLITGTSFFMDLTFTITNAIPKSGSIVIAVTENVSTVDANWVTTDASWVASTNCYIKTYLGDNVVCTVATNSITLTALPLLAAGTSITIRNVVLISTASGNTAKITSIQTYQTATTTFPIDYGSSLASFTVTYIDSTSLGSNNYIPLFNLRFQSSTDAGFASANLAGGNGANTQALQFSIAATPSTDLTSNSVVTINCPFSSTVDDFAIGVPSSSFYFKSTAGVSSSPIDMTTSQAAITSNTPVLTAASSNASLGSVVFTGALGVNQNQHLLIYQPSSTASNFITLPRVANNLATAYECSISIVTTTKYTQRAAIRFVVSPQTWSTKTFTVPCTDILNGIPGIFTFQPSVLSVQTSTAGTTYYVEVNLVSGGTAITANFGSGVASTPFTTTNYEDVIATASVPYPHDKSVSATTFAYNYVAGTINYVAVTGFPVLAVSPATTTTLYFPLGGITSGTTITPTLRSFYVSNADPRYKFITHEADLTGIAFTAATSLTPAAATVVGTTGTDVNGATHNSGLTLNLFGKAAGYGSHYMFFVLGTGYTWTSSKTISNLVAYASPTSYSTVAYFSSLNSAFAFPGVLISSTVAGTSINLGITPGTTTGTIAITGFALPLGAGTSTFSAVLGPTGALAVCYQASQITFTSTTGAITGLAITPNSIKTRGPDGVNIKHVVSFTLQHGIPKGGSINLSFSSDWSTTGCSVCSVNVLTPVSPATTVSCTFPTTTSVLIVGFMDFSASSSVALKITITALLPPASATGSSPKNFVIGLTTNVGLTSATAIIDTIADYSGSAVTVVTSSATGSTIWTTKKTYPMSAGTTNVDLYLKFSFPHSLPTCGVISLTAPMTFKTTGSLINLCFLSPLQYTNCVMSGSTIQITLGQDYVAGSTLELFVDSPFDNPTLATATTGGFAITTSWGLSTVIIDTDPTTAGTVQSTQQFTATPVLATSSTITGITTGSGLTFVPRTAGEAATYTFDFKDSVAYTVGDQYWIVFPYQFDYFLGDVWTWFTNEPNAYYIDCSSTQLGNVWCTVNHNIVVVQGDSAVTAATEIAISINGVINPAASITTGSFQIYHVDISGNYLTINQNYGTVLPTGLPANIDVRSLIQSDNRLYKSSDFTWRIYIYDTMNVDSQLEVLFPKEFDLYHFDQKDAYTCSTSWFDDYATATITTSQSWNSATSCSATGNLISLAAPTTSNIFRGLRDIVTWTIQGIANTQWARPRYAQNGYSDFDIQDNTLWPISPFWASKFTFFVYRTLPINLVYTSRSYPNMNSAYAGFYQGYRPLYVNSYSPLAKSNRIVVFAGTQSQDIWIQTAGPTFPMAAKQILFTPTTNTRTPDSGKLKYTSIIDNWILFQSYWQIRFRVAAAVDMLKGLYYINWANTETKQTGVTDVQYDVPVSTLVEVVGLVTGEYSFSVGTIPSIATGYTTVPIMISVSNPPHSDVTVSISVSGSISNISVSPKTLAFLPDINQMYFQITVASNYNIDLGTAQTLLFTLSGTDASAFAITSSVKFMITQSNPVTSTGSIVNFGLGVATKTTQTVSPTTSQLGVLYYQLSAAGTPIPSFSVLKSTVASLIGNTTNSSPTTTQSSNRQSDPGAGETWFDFQTRLYKTHLQQIWTGAISMTATTAVTTLVFNWLYAGTSYQIAGYIDNLGTFNTTPTLRTEYFTTAPIADSQPFTIKFQGLVQKTFNLTITQTAASIQGVNPLRLANYTYSTSTSRRLQATSSTILDFTSFSYIFLPNRFSESPDPSAQAQITGANLIAFTASLQAQGITNTLNGVTNGAVPTRTYPQWTQTPDSGSSTNSSVTVTFRANTNGKVCCIALNDTINAPTSDQILHGMDGTNTNVTNACVWTDLTKNLNYITISGLIAHTTYYLYCSATDTYPLWPTQMAYSSSNPNVPATITTLPSTTAIVSMSDGRQLGGILCLLALLLN